jgi:DNA polymerase elongation subunit (family B)
MAYKNIYFDRYESQIYLTSDDAGLQVMPFYPYGFIQTNQSSEIKSLFGDNLRLVQGRKALKDALDKGYTLYESDVRPETRFLIDNFLEDHRVATTNTIVFLDIETEVSRSKGFAPPTDPFNKVTAITCIVYNTGEKVTFLLDEDDRYRNTNEYDFVRTYRSEMKMLKEFLIWWNSFQIDIISGWNSSWFDIPYLYHRINRVFGDLEISLGLSPIRQIYWNDRKKTASLAMLSHLDYMVLYKKYTPDMKPTYKLDYISKEELGEQKVPYDGTLQDLYERDIDEYVRYNVVDVDLLIKFEDKFRFIQRTVSLAKIGNVSYESALSAVALTDGMCLTYARHKGIVLPNAPIPIDNQDDEDYDSSKKIVGAYVKPSKRGRFRWAFDLDLTSLYPSIIMTNNVSPETKVATVRNYIDVWSERDTTMFRVNYPIFDASLKKPDPSNAINITVDEISTGKVHDFKTFGDLSAYLTRNNYTISGNGIIYDQAKVGLVPEIVQDLFVKRVEYKDLRDKYIDEGDSNKADFYDNEQWKMKIVLNSIYGVLTNKFFRFFDIDNAQTVTMTGRFVTQSAISEVHTIHHYLQNNLRGPKPSQSLGELFEDPIYTGDTDSIIMSPVPILHYEYGDEWESWDKDKIVQAILKISHKMRDKINARMDLFASDWLHSKNNRLSFKEEWIGESAFFTGVKKRYAIKLVFKEGKPVTKLDIKGLDVVRSSFPKSCQNFMKELLIKLLDFRDKVEIDDYVLQFLDQIKFNLNGDYDMISPISSAKNMEKYAKKDGHFPNGTPIHVKASHNFNFLLEVFGKQFEYQGINEGDKIRYCYLYTTNPYGLKELATPLDSIIPHEVEEFMDDWVDSVKTVDGLLKKKLETYYDALGWGAIIDAREDIEQILFG